MHLSETRHNKKNDCRLSRTLVMSRDYMSCYAPKGNSVGVAISQPRVEVRSASTLGVIPYHLSNSTGVALSRRRYHQPSEIETIAFLLPQPDFLHLCLFSLPTGRCG